MSKKPGVMIYFDIRGVLNMLTLEECGALFRAILEYGETGLVAQRDLLDKARLIWPLVQMSLDRDNDRYREISRRNRYANYVRWQRQRGEEILPRNEWEQIYGVDDDEDALG